MVVDAVSVLDPTTLDLRMIGTKKVQGGGLRDSFLVDGVAFKKTFSYAGFEMQPKSYKDPKILLLNIELELKSEKENAEVLACTGHLSICISMIVDANGCWQVCMTGPCRHMRGSQSFLGIDWRHTSHRFARLQSNHDHAKRHSHMTVILVSWTCSTAWRHNQLLRLADSAK